MPGTSQCVADRRLVAGLALLLVGGAALAALFAGGAIAGDAIAYYEPEPTSDAVEPGETVTVEVYARSDGGYAGEGLDRYSFVVAVDPAAAEIESVESGPFLAEGDGEVVQEVTDVEDGAVRVRQERVGVDDGVTGYDVAATVELRVRDDAPAGDLVVAVGDAETRLAGTDYPVQSFGENATVAVDGGGERLEPTYEPEARPVGDVGVTTAADVNRSASDDGDESGDSDEDDGDLAALPGFGAVAALCALLLAVGLLARRR